MFSVVHDIDRLANDLNHDLEKISEWAFHWKIKFNPDPIKQAQEMTISKKKKVSTHPVVYFDNSPANSIDSKLSFENHLQSVFSRVNKTIDLFIKLQPTLLKKSVVHDNI